MKDEIEKLREKLVNTLESFISENGVPDLEYEFKSMNGDIIIGLTSESCLIDVNGETMDMSFTYTPLEDLAYLCELLNVPPKSQKEEFNKNFDIWNPKTIVTFINVYRNNEMYALDLRDGSDFLLDESHEENILSYINS